MYESHFVCEELCIVMKKKKKILQIASFLFTNHHKVDSSEIMTA